MNLAPPRLQIIANFHLDPLFPSPFMIQKPPDPKFSLFQKKPPQCPHTHGGRRRRPQTFIQDQKLVILSQTPPPQTLTTHPHTSNPGPHFSLKNPESGLESAQLPARTGPGFFRPGTLEPADLHAPTSLRTFLARFSSSYPMFWPRKPLIF